MAIVLDGDLWGVKAAQAPEPRDRAEARAEAGEEFAGVLKRFREADGEQSAASETGRVGEVAIPYAVPPATDVSAPQAIETTGPADLLAFPTAPGATPSADPIVITEGSADGTAVALTEDAVLKSELLIDRTLVREAVQAEAQVAPGQAPNALPGSAATGTPQADEGRLPAASGPAMPAASLTNAAAAGQGAINRPVATGDKLASSQSSQAKGPADADTSNAASAAADIDAGQWPNQSATAGTAAAATTTAVTPVANGVANRGTADRPTQGTLAGAHTKASMGSDKAPGTFATYDTAASAFLVNASSFVEGDAPPFAPDSQDASASMLTQSLVAAAAPSHLANAAPPSLVSGPAGGAPTGAVIVAAPAQIVEIISDTADNAQSDRVVVQLDPPELGRVSIDFKFDAQGLQHVTITSETPEAMRQLRQMHSELVHSLERHGISSENMSFEHQQHSDRPARSPGTSARKIALIESGLTETTSTATPRPGRTATALQDGRLDIRL